MLIQTHLSDWWYGLSEDSTQAPEAESPYERDATTGITVFKEFAVHKKRLPPQAKELKRANTQKTKLVGIYETHFLFSNSVLFFFQILEKRLLGSVFWATCWVS